MSRKAVSKRQKLKGRMTIGTWAKNVSARVKKEWRMLNPKYNDEEVDAK